MPEHGETYTSRERCGNFTEVRFYRWCANHGAINLFICDNWDELHGTGACERTAEEIRQAEINDFERAARKAA